MDDTTTISAGVTHVGDHGSVADAVARAVAAAEDATPLDLEPLGSEIDADALERLVVGRDGRRRGGVDRVAFGYHGYDVTVLGDGRVTVEEPGG